MNPQTIFSHAVIPTLDLLPTKMTSLRATALVMAIGFQESGFDSRTQIGGGPARGYWQFEQGGGVKGVLEHGASREHITKVLLDLDLLKNTDLVVMCYNLIAYNDMLAAAFARLLLWTSPKPLPSPGDSSGAWEYYLNCWRPGKLRPDSWNGNLNRAWDLVSHHG